MGRKTIAETRAQLVNLVAKLEGTKKQASVNAYRQAFKRLVELDADCTIKGYKSILVMLRNDARAIVAKKLKKKR